MNKILLFAALSLMAVACGKDDKNPISNFKEANEDVDLQGKNFESACLAETSGGIQSSRVAYEFQGSNIVRSTILFTTPTCSIEAYRYKDTGTFNITKNQRTADGGYFIDINFNNVAVLITTDAGAVVANAAGLCGAADWATSQEREVTAAAKSANCYGADVPRVNFNVYRIDGGNTLYLGSATLENGAARPTALAPVAYINH